MLLLPERGFGCALLLWLEIQPLVCCFVLRLRLLVASMPGSPAGGSDGACLALDEVVRCSSASGAEFEFWRPGALCWSPVRSTLRQLRTSRSSSDLSRLLIGFSSSHCWALLHWRHLSVVWSASTGDRYLSGLRAGNCGLPLWRRIHSRVWLVACPVQGVQLPLPLLFITPFASLVSLENFGFVGVDGVSGSGF